MSATAEFDVMIVGAGPTGLACAIEAGRAGLRTLVVEKGCLVNSIYHYPTNMVFFTTAELLEIGGIPFTCAAAKPTRLEALEYYRRVATHYGIEIRQYERAIRVERLAASPSRFRLHTEPAGGGSAAYTAAHLVLATGYYDLPNRLEVPGEDLPHVHHYFREAHPFAGLPVAVIGAKNFAAETALDLYRHGARVTLIHRGSGLGASIKYWVRPDIENRIKAGEIAALWHTRVAAIEPGRLQLVTAAPGEPERRAHLEAAFVFALVGYHPDFEFLREAGVEFDAAMRPCCDPRTLESNVPGLYLGGVIVAGRNTSEIFIENGRFHGQAIVADIVARRGRS